jgi:hypothetical protein
MAKAQATTTIAKPADEVWGRIRDFVDVTWIPNTESSFMEGDERHVKMQGMSFEVVQRLVNHDDAGRTYSYELPRPIDLEPVLGPGHVVSKIDATIVVAPASDSESFVTWDVDTEDFMVGGVHAEYQGALDNLKALLEG